MKISLSDISHTEMVYRLKEQSSRTIGRGIIPRPMSALFFNNPLLIYFISITYNHDEDVATMLQTPHTHIGRSIMASNVHRLADIPRNVNKVRPAPQTDIVDKDVEYISSLIQKSRLTDEEIARRISEIRKSKMSPITVRKIRELAVRRPLNYTLDWIGHILGKRRVWVNI